MFLEDNLEAQVTKETMVNGVSRRRERLGDARVALIVVLVAFFLGLLVGRASADDAPYGKGDTFDPPDNVTVQISGKTFKQWKAIREYVCDAGSIGLLGFSPGQIVRYDRACK